MENYNFVKDSILTTEDADDNDNEQSEIPTVNFLIEVKNPCLICGCDVDEIDNIVKQEVSEGVGVEDDYSVFHWFLKWFRVDIVKKGKQRLVDRGWDGHGGDILKFCGGCKGELIKLLELQREVDELEKRIRNGLGEVKGKIEGCEGVFQSNGIYERDHRYRRVRSRIVKCGSVGENSKQLSLVDNPRRSSFRQPVEVETGSSRRSSRRKPNSWDMEPLQEVKVPVVVLSPLDTARADQLITADLNDSSDNDVKPDISEELCDNSFLISPPIKVRKTLKKKKATSHVSGTRKKSKAGNNHVERKSSQNPKKPKKISKPPKILVLADEDEDNYFLDDNHDNDIESDPDFNKDKSSDKPQPKRRTVKDDDFIPEDNISSDEDDNDDLAWKSTRSDHNRKLNYKLDSSTNTITFGNHTFSISSNSQETITCTSCNCSLKNKRKSMTTHITKHHSNRFACSQCPFKAEKRNVLSRHIKSVHGGVPGRKTFPCKICGKPIYKRRSHEWTHMSKEEQEEIIKNDPGRLPDYLRKRSQCDECGKGFKGPADLKRHQKKWHEGAGEEKELCPECGKTVGNLKGHLRWAHGGLPKYECLEEGCGKRFKILSLLTRHKDRMHRGIRPWGCTMCTRTFAGEETLKRHVDLHLGIRRWKCEVEGCGGAFATKGNLKKHFKCFHEEGSRPKRKSYQRGPTVLGVGFRKEDLVREGTYYPPSALQGWAKGRVPGHLVGVVGEDDGEEEVDKNEIR